MFVLYCKLTEYPLSIYFQVKIWFQNRRTKWKKQDGVSNAEAAELKTNGEKHNSQGTTKKSSKSKATVTVMNNNTTVNNVGCLQQANRQLINGPVTVFTSTNDGSLPKVEQNSGTNPEPSLTSSSPPLISKSVTTTSDVISNNANSDISSTNHSPPTTMTMVPIATMTPPLSVVENGGLDSDSRASDVFCWGRSSSPSSMAGDSSVDNSENNNVQIQQSYVGPCYASNSVVDASINTSSYQEKEMRPTVKTIGVEAHLIQNCVLNGQESVDPEISSNSH